MKQHLLLDFAMASFLELKHSSIRAEYLHNLNGLFRELKQEDLSVDIMRIIDKLEKIGEENVIASLKDLGVSEDAISKIMEFIKIKGTTDEKLQALENLQFNDELFIQGLTELKQVVNYVRMFGVPDKNFKVDLTIARGLDYYTGTVYETFLNEYREIGSVCSGGRYDNLAEFYTDKKLPGVGVSIGFTRLFYKLNELNAIKETQKSIAKVLIAPMTENIERALEVSKILRDNGINTEVYLEDKKIKAKFKYADHLQIPYVIIIGEDEIENKTVSLKNMENGEQQTISLDEAIKILK